MLGGEAKEGEDWEGRRKEGGRAGGDTWERERERERECKVGGEWGRKEGIAGGKKNRGRRKRREEGLERIAKSEEPRRKQKRMGRGNGKMEGGKEIIPP